MAEKRSEQVPERQTAGIRPWSPFRDFGWPFGRLFDELLGERWVPWTPATTMGRWTPALDLHENDNAYVVTVELPGAKREDIHVEVHENVLTIRGEKRSERESSSEKRHYVERCYGSFSRAFTLPAGADTDRIQATFKDGVLTVEIPKTEQKKPKQVDIKG